MGTNAGGVAMEYGTQLGLGGVNAAGKVRRGTVKWASSENACLTESV
jgi:hypothetical protein